MLKICNLFFPSLHSVFHLVLAAFSSVFISRGDDVMVGYMSLSCQAICSWREFVSARVELDGWQCPSWWTPVSLRFLPSNIDWLTPRSLLTFSEHWRSKVIHFPTGTVLIDVIHSHNEILFMQLTCAQEQMLSVHVCFFFLPLLVTEPVFAHSVWCSYGVGKANLLKSMSNFKHTLCDYVFWICTASAMVRTVFPEENWLDLGFLESCM